MTPMAPRPNDFENPADAERAARDAAERETPGIKTPPPIYFVATVLVAEVVQGVWSPLSFGLGDAGVAAGIAVAILGVILVVLALREFWRAKTSVDVRRRSEALVQSGPFAYSRNPIYVAAALLQAGAGIGFDRPWIVIAVFAALLLIRYRVIALEEPYLESRFGDDFLAYKARVRRWI
jgi:protein-S-isoprenylcysteine O-methyltransferase Ste14